MTKWEPKVIIDLLIEMGEFARRSQESLRVKTKKDSTLVTQVDTAIEKTIARRLVGGDSMLLGEESAHTANASLLRGVCWVIDPIDGTHPYIHSLPEWGISVARMENGYITDGAIFLPHLNRIFITNKRKILTVCPPTQRRPTVYSVTPNRFTPGMVGLTQDITKRGTYRGPESVQASGCCIYSIARFLMGQYTAVVLRIKLWDVAACVALLDRTPSYMLLNTHRFTPEVSDTLYYTEDGHPRQWSSRHHIVIGWSREQVHAIQHAIATPSK